MKSYRQLILFGSPGTGKSHKVKVDILPSLGITSENNNSVHTVFHPEYTYGDFVGKILPLTIDKQVDYKYYEGSFLKAIAKAYKNILNIEEGTNPENVALIIDEINRGNSAAIFGIGFQLLDRDLDGWSTYSVDVSDMEFDKILRLMDISKFLGNNQQTIYQYGSQRYSENDFDDFLMKRLKIKRKQIRIPGNMSIIATMNTSDSSIYHMDSAFKRRWEWQYIDVSGDLPADDISIAFPNRNEWKIFINKLNSFIKSQTQFIRKAEDKQIGHYFVQDEQVSKSSIQNKVMFFIWDSVFTTSKKPLYDLLELDEKALVTFGDFTKQVDNFIEKILNYK